MTEQKSIFEFGDKFGIESPFGNWLDNGSKSISIQYLTSYLDGSNHIVSLNIISKNLVSKSAVVTIFESEVFLNEAVITKAYKLISNDVKIEISFPKSYLSKLSKSVLEGEFEFIAKVFCDGLESSTREFRLSQKPKPKSNKNQPASKNTSKPQKVETQPKVVEGAWFVKNEGKEKGSYEWFDDQDEKHDGYIRVGLYKVLFNESENKVIAYKGKNAELVETLSMETEQDENNNFKKYKSDRAAKFAMISAELGGKGFTQFDALVISASIENRINTLNSGRYSKYDIEKSQLVSKYKGKEKYVIQDLFTSAQYQSVVYTSYQNFVSGCKSRFNEDAGSLNSSLSIVYYSLDDPNNKLNDDYSFKSAINIFSYAHGKNKPVVFQQYDIEFKKENAPNLKYIVGSKFWKPN